MAQTTQLWPPVTANRIVQTLIARLATHPLLTNPPVWDNEGNPIRITKWRNYDGLELENFDLTCSVFPYHYTSSDSGTVTTVHSENVGTLFKPHTLGGGVNGGDQSATDEAMTAIVIKLHLFGYSREQSEDNQIVPGQQTRFDFNFNEFLLRQYADLMAHVLRSPEIQLLPSLQTGKPLLASSFPHHMDWSTSRWEKGANLLLHSATVIWHAKYYVVRNWKRPSVWVSVDLADGTLVVGSIPASAVGTTGLAVGVVFDTIQAKWFWARLIPAVAPSTVPTRVLEDLDPDLLVDPGTNEPYQTLDPDLLKLIADTPNGPFDFSLYFKRVGQSPDNC